jgi:hypothetical protein
MLGEWCLASKGMSESQKVAGMKWGMLILFNQGRFPGIDGVEEWIEIECVMLMQIVPYVRVRMWIVICE